MNSKPITPKEILEDREERQNFREQDNEKGIKVTFSLNVPGLEKFDDVIYGVFLDISQDVIVFLENVLAMESWEHSEVDAAGAYTLLTFQPNVDADAIFIKKLCEIFEQYHSIGRLLDLDVYDIDGKRVSGGRVKPCFVCGEDAKLCIRGQKHTVDEARAAFFEMLLPYANRSDVDIVGDYFMHAAFTAMIAEAALHPKPGLVTRNSSGSHSDMNFDLFAKSAMAIAPGFGMLAVEVPGIETLDQFRAIGLQMELWMLNATGGVNTHKGMIFILGLMVYAAGISIDENEGIEHSYIEGVIKEFTKGITNELKYSLDTHGGKMFDQHKLTGARGEAESGMPTILNHGFPRLWDHLPVVYDDADDIVPFNSAYKAALVSIIAENDDTNVVYRAGLDKLKELKKLAKAVLAEGIWNKNSDKKYEELCQFCEENNISCGGSADLFAATIFLNIISK